MNTMEDKERQLMDMMACDLQSARRSLQQCDGDVDRAIDALLMASSSKEEAVVTHHSSDTSAGWSTSANEAAEVPKGEVSWAERVNEGPRRSERNAKNRTSPIDLTGDDEDEDLRKAMQASLESESNRQKRHQDFGLGGSRANAHGVSEDDEALTRAIEASMLHSRSVTRDQSPQLSASHLDTLGGKRLRSPERPVAILAPTPHMGIFALALQALYASEPLRQALLNVRFADVRIQQADMHTMEAYWRGASPAGIIKPSADQWNSSGIPADQQDITDGIMRLITLFTFMTYTKRSLVIAEDVITHGPIRNNYAYVMNSERRPSQDILSCYLQGVLDMVSSVSTNLEQVSSDLCDAEALKRSFQSFTVNAEAPASQTLPNNHTARQPASDAYEVVVHNLVQSNVNNSVHRALYSCLADEKALYSNPADTLFFCLGRSGQINPNFGAIWEPEISKSALAPFKLETRVYLDAFLFSRRNGVRLGLDTDEVQRRQDRIAELERYRKTICTFQGEDARATLKASIGYFQKLCNDDGSDDLRSSSVNEAGPRLEAILAHLEQEIHAVDEQLQRERQAVEVAQGSTLSTFEDMLSKEEYQTLPYDLQAVVFENEQTSWAYVRNRDDIHAMSAPSEWWCVREGEATQVTEADVLGDGNRIILMVYTAVSAMPSANAGDAKGDISNDTMMQEDEEGGGKPSKTIRLDSGRDWWSKQALVEAIEHDNARFGMQLASQLSPANKNDATRPNDADGEGLDGHAIENVKQVL